MTQAQVSSIATPELAAQADPELKRLYWHSRRGMWELDLLLIPFLQHRYPYLSAADQQAYQDLITCEDQDLFVWMMRRELPEDSEHKRIVEMIIDHAENTNSDQYRTL
ncbi:antitoxin CptB [Allopseudospirillum japonicum]|uniref:FAD assembly factor SdhE n=1 Tax=Allopseudospirillum japonicum TaxID=64971 RepID=A0A1H6SJ66_9GAMM|nr:succinate dehydrogenase assembly factor 2 [Allopseudospirillum japonicum]SEI63542.1 antitoxin CptB [Allopseudospirillum japonicum]